MVALEIEDIKGFTSDLFVGTKFDSFLLKEARFVTFAVFDIDGKVREDYYTREEREEGRDRRVFGLERLEAGVLLPYKRKTAAWEL